ncbi:MAG: hypothetical protein A3J48_04745 [Candidatus Doudnabacteria bacterium RIFCSPHIGHO2_02_FULL_46_11]|uniref:Uncharacterized protein n=1 Tax=Candidatus Doudnabacteria bacterium RIFCSPHIGHO2_02_FULL_46_11 TaxID=1817832 RepID=A0A1F5P8C6_9BACT|nr:MAG: hypothetical protein A3J48_04745 [Candidatus Doudnabacteria bacterium RIFCSPHIGHO2_02_FULL_46_11]
MPVPMDSFTWFVVIAGYVAFAFAVLYVGPMVYRWLNRPRYPRVPGVREFLHPPRARFTEGHRDFAEDVIDFVRAVVAKADPKVLASDNRVYDVLTEESGDKFGRAVQFHQGYVKVFSYADDQSDDPYDDTYKIYWLRFRMEPIEYYAVPVD